MMDADSGLIIDDLEQEENSENVDPDEDEEAAEQVQFEKGTTTHGALALWFRGHRYVRRRTNCAWFRCEKRFCPASAKLVDEEMMHDSTLRDLMALALIPVGLVRKAFCQCLSVAPQGIEDFLRYFARTYVGLYEFERELGEAAFEPGAEFEFRRRYPIADRWDLPIVVSPRYEPSFWNVHDRARLVIEKTNNPLEIQHKLFSKNLNHHPSMVHFFQALSDDTDIQLDRGCYWAQHPEEAAKPSRKKYVLKEGDLLAVLDAVDYLAPGEPHVTVRSLAHQMITYTEAIPGMLLLNM
ncbi:hypothetical protein GPALN_006021 [Globodera pallida]|nr:hypothetical protein GPALN_006021 [Globodera pallida]